MSDQPGPSRQKRKRLSRACEECHRIKRKCNGRPQCNNCTMSGKICLYRDSKGVMLPPPLPAAAEDRPRRSVSSEPQSAWSDTASVYTSVSLPLRVIASATDLPRLPTLEISSELSYELINLFFAHCHPPSLIVHRITFYSALSRGEIPQYLRYAIYTLGSLYSRRPSVRKSPNAEASHAYAKQALYLMFNERNTLLCDINLYTVQAICLLEFHRALSKLPDERKLWDVALSILLSFHQYKSPDEPSPTPKRKLEHDGLNPIEEECARRAFWFLRCLDVTTYTYLQTTTTIPMVNEMSFPMPIDEKTFQLTLVGDDLDTSHRQISEFANVVKLVKMHIDAQFNLSTAKQQEDNLQDWRKTAPSHLIFSDENHHAHSSMLRTPANTGAWCYLYIQILYNLCTIAVKKRKDFGYEDELNRLEDILEVIAADSEVNLLTTSLLWGFANYKPDTISATVENGQKRHAQFWGYRVGARKAAPRSTSRDTEPRRAVPSLLPWLADEISQSHGPDS